MITILDEPIAVIHHNEMHLSQVGAQFDAATYKIIFELPVSYMLDLATRKYSYISLQGEPYKIVAYAQTDKHLGVWVKTVPDRHERIQSKYHALGAMVVWPSKDLYSGTDLILE